jgi:hypothetical protein
MITTERNDEGRITTVKTTAADWGEETATRFGSGIRKLDFLRLRNLQGYVNDEGPYVEDDVISLPGFTRIRIRGERIDMSAGGAIVARVFDGAGFFADCDPVATSLVADAPEAFGLEQSYPNPFQRATTIPFRLAENTHVRLSVYDMLGREVAQLLNKEMDAGTYEVQWSAPPLASGTYIYQIEAGSFRASRQFSIVR